MVTLALSAATAPSTRSPFDALLLSFTGASRPIMQQYADVLHLAGALRIAFSLPTVWQLGVSEAFTSGVAAAAAEALGGELPVLICVFSDGGAMQYRMLHKALWGGASGSAEPPAALAAFRERVFGVAFDSSPSPNRALNMAPGLAELMGGGRAWVSALLELPLLLGTSLQMHVFTDRQGDWPLPILGARAPNVPHLFMIGELDPLTPPEHVAAVLAARRGALDGGSAAGAPPPSRVTYAGFPTASHLELLSKDPRHYEVTLLAFVDALFAEMIFAPKDLENPRESGGRSSERM